MTGSIFGVAARALFVASVLWLFARGEAAALRRAEGSASLDVALESSEITSASTAGDGCARRALSMFGHTLSRAEGLVLPQAGEPHHHQMTASTAGQGLLGVFELVLPGTRQGAEPASLARSIERGWRNGKSAAAGGAIRFDRASSRRAAARRWNAQFVWTNLDDPSGIACVAGGHEVGGCVVLGVAVEVVRQERLFSTLPRSVPGQLKAAPVAWVQSRPNAFPQNDAVLLGLTTTISKWMAVGCNNLAVSTPISGQGLRNEVALLGAELALWPTREGSGTSSTCDSGHSHMDGTDTRSGKRASQGEVL